MGTYIQGFVPVLCVCIVVFLYSQGSKSEDVDLPVDPHHIVKRSTAAAPAATEFTLTKDVNAPSSPIKVGHVIAFTLTIAFKAGNTDMTVELFTPGNTNTAMILCDVQVDSIGSLGMTGSTMPVYESKDGSVYYDRAVINLGVVTNNLCSTLAQCQMLISYKAVMIDNPLVTDGQYWISAGAEYENQAFLWVGQCSVDIVMDKVISAQPTVNVTGPGEVPIGSVNIYGVSLYLPNPSESVTFTGFTPLNTSSVMTICSAKIKSMGSNFNCGYDSSLVTNTLYPATTGLGNAMAEVNGGTFLNSGSRVSDDAYDDNVIEFEFIVHTYLDSTFVDQTFDVGAALDISGSQIWAATTSSKGIPEINTLDGSFPNLSVDPGYDSNVEIDKSTAIILNIAIPYNTTSSYQLTVETPLINDAPVFQLCSVVLISAGNNLPCVTLDKATIYFARNSAGSYADKSVTDFGGVTNLPIEASSQLANSIKARIVFTPLDHPSATVSSQHDLTVMLSNAEQSTTITTLFTIAGTNAGTANVTSPEFNMTFGIGTDNVLIGLATRAVLEVTTARTDTYSKMDIEFIMASGNTSSKFKVCRSKILSVGENLPCIMPAWLNDKVTYTSKFNDNINNRAVYNVGGVCNLDLNTDVAEDKMLVAVDLEVLDHDEMNAKEWISAGFMYSPTKIWVGQLAINPISGVVAPTTTPYIHLIKNTTLTVAPIGFPMVYSIIVKIAPGESADLLVVVESTTAGLHVCGLRIMSAGDNFPCLDQTLEPVFDTWPTGDNNRATFNASYVTNVGSDALVSNGLYDDNSILFEVIVQLASTVADGAALGFTTTVTYASGQSKAIATSLTATSNTSIIDRNVTQSANFSFYMASIDQNDTTYIAHNEAKRFILDMTLPESLTGEYTVKFLTSPTAHPGFMEVCDAAVIEVGKNFPCLRKTEIHSTFEKRTDSNYNGIATLYLGFICSSAMKSDEVSNRIRVEGIFKLLHNTSAVAGDTHTVHVAINNNDFEIFVSNVELTQTDTLDPKYNNTIDTNQTSLYVNLTDDIIDMKIGAIITFPIVFNINPGSVSKVKFDVDTLANNSVVALVKDIRLKGTGSNIACLYVDEALDQTFTPVLNSSQGTCQIDQGYVDLDVVSNPGLSYRKGTNADGDDSIHLEVDLMLTDFELAEHNAVFSISFGGMVTNIIVLCEQKIRVIRDNSEKPELEFTADVNGTLSNDTHIFIDGVIVHTNTSSGRAVNASLFMFLPPYLFFANLTQTNVTPVEIINEKGYIEFGDLLLCNAVAFTVLLETNNSVEVPIDIVPANTTVYMEAGSNVYQRSGSTLASDAFLTTETQVLSFSAKVTQDDSCNDIMGMETGIIKDCQLASSFESDRQYPAIHGRFKGNSAWAPFVRGGSLSPYRYFQVYFGNITLVAKIIMQLGNRSQFPDTVNVIALYYSNDGTAYEKAEEIEVSSKFTVSDTIEVRPGRPTPARYIRIYLLTDTAGTAMAKIGLKFEFIGCFKSSDITATEICNLVTKYQPTQPEFHFRSMALNTKTSSLHFCDATPVTDGVFTEEMRIGCARSNDGDTFTKLSDVVGCLLGYDKTQDRMYAWHKNKRTMLMSTNDGDNWDTVNLDAFFTSRDAGQDNNEFLFSKPIGWQSSDDLNSSEPHTNYQLGNWGATHKGLFFFSQGRWKQRTTWNAV
ncbi:uncharacterized protein LOC110448839 isoform X2 [Mizuhopecten yessoensis]|uniref:uncharacterized protein LOC110448839 isoform X2 n=1 Tax=Mizuhopecten yessoensis TaxID=6573 RepID=UPI000B45C46E|nr:uncharacterized protein LOC110448839 isoform X2 [Mizuhopecten yessoensis]